jgi:hypothetical protein
MWSELFQLHRENMTPVQYDACITAMSEKHESEDFGHDNMLTRCREIKHAHTHNM